MLLHCAGKQVRELNREQLEAFSRVRQDGLACEVIRVGSSVYFARIGLVKRIVPEAQEQEQQ